MLVYKSLNGLAPKYIKDLLCGACAVWVYLCWLLGMEPICGDVPLWGGDSWRVGSGACIRYLCPGWGWPCGYINGWGLLGTGVGLGGWGRTGSDDAGTSLDWCWCGLPVSTPKGRGPPPGSGGWLTLWGIGTWTFMGSVSECTTSIVVCLHIGCVGVSVFMCTHEGGNV
ncbi:hypothetical protein ILYODFUR_012844 [Ilyodon furcidens]|uniref:Uncharacterized protein n=1 Tax=Ilyodon furcidens TaxID=33524 RepID=A0ABV0VDG7_9TELE